MTYSESLTAVGSLAVNNKVAAYLTYDGGVGRDFYPVASALQAVGGGTVSSYLPSIGTITEHTYVDSAGNSIAGSYELDLNVSTSDTVNAASPLDRIVLEPGSRVITATG